MLQIDRMEERLQTIDDRTRNIEMILAELRGERKASLWIGRFISAVIAAAAGAVAGNIHFPPGAH
jgi:hypothetical protein